MNFMLNLAYEKFNKKCARRLEGAILGEEGAPCVEGRKSSRHGLEGAPFGVS
jgi:hypothetical protein